MHYLLICVHIHTGLLRKCFQKYDQYRTHQVNDDLIEAKRNVSAFNEQLQPQDRHFE